MRSHIRLNDWGYHQDVQYFDKRPQNFETVQQYCSWKTFQLYSGPYLLGEFGHRAPKNFFRPPDLSLSNKEIASLRFELKKFIRDYKKNTV